MWLVLVGGVFNECASRGQTTHAAAVIPINQVIQACSSDNNNSVINFNAFPSFIPTATVSS